MVCHVRDVGMGFYAPGSSGVECFEALFIIRFVVSPAELCKHQENERSGMPQETSVEHADQGSVSFSKKVLTQRPSRLELSLQRQSPT